MAKQVTGNEAQFNEKVTFLKNIDVNGNVVVGSGITINASTGEISATSFSGDGSLLTGIIAVNNGVYVTKNNILVGTPGIGVTIGLGTGLNGNQSAVGIVTIFLDATINDLTNVNASPNTSDVLQWNGSTWVAANPTSIGSTIWQTVPTGAGTTQAYYNEGAVAIGTDAIYGDCGLIVTQSMRLQDIPLNFSNNAVFNTSYISGGVRNFFLGAANPGSTGNDNFMSGFRSGLTNTTGCRNVFLGFFVGAGNTSGSENIYLGSFSGGSGGASCNNFIGYGAGRCGYGFCNNGIGYETGSGNGCNNNVIGCKAGYHLYCGNDNNFIGTLAGCGIIVNTNGVRNNFIGYHAGRFITCGSDNVAIGSSSGYSNCLGCNNVFVGTLAGFGNTTGSDNTYIGSYTGACNTTGCQNVFIGPAAGLNNTTGTNNVYIGRFAGQCSTTTNGNIAIGELSLFKNTKFLNIAIGSGAGCNLTAGANAEGSYNILIGTNSGDTLTVGANNIIIGDRGVDPLTCTQTISLKGFTTQSNRISIGNVCTTNFYTKMASCSSLSGGVAVQWSSSSYELAAVTSSIRYKTNVRPFLSGIQEILKLQTVKYNSIDNPTGQDEVGFIAEELDKDGLSDFVVYNADNQPEAISYDRLITLAVNAIKELHQENQELKNEISLIKNHLDL